jgi:hypothetical protein
MPITQDRLLRLISAGEHYRDSTNTLRHSVLAKCSQIFKQTMTIEQALSELTAELNIAVPFDATAASILAEERTRYNLTHKRNSIERRRIYNRRHPPEPTSQTLPKRSIAEVMAQVDAEDEALQGLADLGFQTPATEPDEYITPEYLAWKASQQKKEES